VNCGSIPETLAESILFGHEKGAFTGALATKAGVFEATQGGTLFLDEIGELPAAHQARLLRVLEERVVRRVGGLRDVPVDVRVIAATHRDLDREVARGQFRRDLLYRIDVLRIRVPPLRERLDELPELVPALLSELGADAPAGPNEEVISLLRGQAFPGNVRELRNVLARALALSESGRLDAAAVAAALPDGALDRPASELRGQVASAEREAIERALEATGGNQTHAARKLGISRRALLYKMQRYGLGRANERNRT
jgi:DNA-binding NtrC family response regulator